MYHMNFKKSCNCAAAGVLRAPCRALDRGLYSYIGPSSPESGMSSARRMSTKQSRELKAARTSGEAGREGVELYMEELTRREERHLAIWAALPASLKYISAFVGLIIGLISRRSP